MSESTSSEPDVATLKDAYQTWPGTKGGIWTICGTKQISDRWARLDKLGNVLIGLAIALLL